MVRVVLADSEAESLRNFKTYIKANFKDMNVVESLSQSAGFSENIKRLKPDLLIFDIRFVGVNSPVVFRELHEALPDMRFLVYGYYGDTGYMERLLPYGAVDYMYRPVKQQDLELALKKAERALAERDKIHKEKKRVLSELDSQKPFFRDGFLNSIINGELILEHEIDANFRYFGLKIKAPYRVVLLRIGHFRDIISKTDEEGKYYLSLKTFETVRSSAEKRGGCVVFARSLSLVGIVAGGSEELSEIYDFTSQIRNELEQVMQIQVTASIGRAYTSSSEIAFSFREAEAALRHRSYIGYGSIIPIEYVEPLNPFTYCYPKEKETRLVYASVLGEYDLAVTLVDQFFEALDVSLLPENMLAKIVMDIVLAINRFACERDKFTHEIKHFFPTREIFGLTTKELASAYLKKCLSGFCSHMNSLILQNAAQKVIAAKKYADDNFRGDISVSKLCNNLKIPQEFFLRFFSDTEGMSFGDYVNKLRIENAKKLLKETMLEEEVVAMRSGFTDHVFYKLLFRQATNMLPAEYRKKYYAP